MHYLYSRKRQASASCEPYIFILELHLGLTDLQWTAQYTFVYSQSSMLSAWNDYEEEEWRGLQASVKDE